MIFVSKQNSTEKKPNEVCTITEHPTGDESINFATAKIRGRYPSQGYARNKLSKEIAYVHEGNGTLTVNNKEYSLNAGDLVLIEVGEQFCWEGNMTLSLSCTPAWRADQYEIVD